MNMVEFQKMPYVRPDMEALKACTEKTIEILKGAASYEAARTAFFALQDEEEKAGTMMSLCHVRNTIDTTDAFYEGEVKWLREQNAAMIPLRKAYREALAASPFRPQFEAEFGPQMFRMIDASLKTSDERIIPDVIREGGALSEVPEGQRPRRDGVSGGAVQLLWAVEAHGEPGPAGAEGSLPRLGCPLREDQPGPR